MPQVRTSSVESNAPRSNIVFNSESQGDLGWMDVWILQGANTGFRAATVPRIEEREEHSHSDEGAGSWRG